MIITKNVIFVANFEPFCADKSSDELVSLI